MLRRFAVVHSAHRLSPFHTFAGGRQTKKLAEEAASQMRMNKLDSERYVLLGGLTSLCIWYTFGMSEQCS